MQTITMKERMSALNRLKAQLGENGKLPLLVIGSNEKGSISVVNAIKAWKSEEFVVEDANGLEIQGTIVS